MKEENFHSLKNLDRSKNLKESTSLNESRDNINIGTPVKSPDKDSKVDPSLLKALKLFAKNH